MGRYIHVFVIVLCLASAALAYGPEHEEESWFESMGHRISGWMPWNSKLGHDWTDTQHKVEAIYQGTHAEAQRRVEQLKEEALKSAPEVREKIAEIYAEEAAKAEREIEALKRPMLDWFRVQFRKLKPDRSHDHDHDHDHSTLRDAVDKSVDKSKLMAHKVQEEFEALPHKISSTYKSALDQAKSKLDQMGSSASSNLHDAKQNLHDAKEKAAKAYSDAFHKGHGKARTLLTSVSDTLGRGFTGTKHAAHAVVDKAWDMFTTILMALFFTILGATIALTAVSYWSNRRFTRQLNSHVAGPIVAVGEYMVLGDEAAQRKFYEFWSGPAHAFFSRQPGLRKHWMHRGVAGAENNWLTYSEWESVDALRRAHDHPEFADLRRRGPKPAMKQMLVYQLGSIGPVEGSGTEGQVLKETGGQGQALRQRGFSNLPTATATT